MVEDRSPKGGGGEAEEDGDGGPDVGGEVDGVGGEGVGVGVLRRSLRRAWEREKSTTMDRVRTRNGQGLRGSSEMVVEDDAVERPHR